MKFSSKDFIISVCLVFAWASSCLAGDVIKAVKITEPPVIDGDLSDACWKSASKFTDFHHLETGAEGLDPTIAYIAYDAEYAYVGIDCIDSKPEEVRSQQMKRGGAMDTDDYVTVYFDPLMQYWNQSMSVFTMNAAGTQMQRIFSNNKTKTEWSGKWESAAKHTPTGYSLEMKIPFSVMKFGDTGGKMGIGFVRHSARYNLRWWSPNLGKNTDYSKMYVWKGIEARRITTKPITLLYSVLGAGDGDKTTDGGLDIKFQPTPKITGLFTVNPDFRNVERQVESVDFSYTEKTLAERRPFFSEGEDLFPGTRVWYTKRIQKIDTGVKAIAQGSNYKLGLINTQSFGNESFSVLNSNITFGQKKDLSIWMGSVLCNVDGKQNLAFVHTTTYALRLPGDRLLNFNYSAINADDYLGKGHGLVQSYGATSAFGPRKLNFGVSRNTIDSDFNPYLAVGMDKGITTLSTSLNYGDKPSDGPISSWQISLARGSSDKDDGRKFGDSLSPTATIALKNGLSASLSYSDSKRLQKPEVLSELSMYHDKTWSTSIGWGGNDLYNIGSAVMTFGNVTGGDYLYYKVYQGYLFNDHISGSASTEYLRLSAPSPSASTARQTIVSANYDFTPDKSVGGRWVSTSGKSNFYISYQQKLISGLDIYLIYGDPNSPTSRNTFLLKLIRPM